MRLPRNVSGEELAKFLEKYDFQITRQTGSHMRLTTIIKGVYHITIPKHKSLKIGTLSCILTDIANYLKINRVWLFLNDGEMVINTEVI